MSDVGTETKEQSEPKSTEVGAGGCPDDVDSKEACSNDIGAPETKEIEPEGPELETVELESVVSAWSARASALWLRSLVLELGGPKAEIGVRLCSDDVMSEANGRFRQKPMPTDVLSFPNEPDAEPETGESQAQAHYLGDVLISIDTAKRQAAQAGQSLDWELQCLILHGLLHCLGHDHATDVGQMDTVELGLRERWVNEASPWALPDGAERPLGAIEVSSDPDLVTQAAQDANARFGRVALVGRPNAGKSTLMNHWLGEKVAIVSDKPQTTRHRIVGIHSEERGQMVFLDTPGIHKPQHRLNRRMVKAASDALSEADVICLLVDASVKPGGGDHWVQEMVIKARQPKMVLLNKIDIMRKSRLLPLIEKYTEAGFDPVIPISALDGDGAEAALDQVWEMLPRGNPEFDSDMLTLQTERFLSAERIREKILERTRDELPYVVAVVIDQWEEREGGVLYLAASILVERSGQKSILIGKGGAQIKEVGIAARADLEGFLRKRVFLDLVVRESKGWREDPRIVGEIENYLMA